ncbi:hypothetical protein [Paenibacillus sp. FSL H7-0331]|uniref:hypothetical protein n=1 Tax=Paenibacillus sp. FSL H7-0331 TaxID=1920421 RepID=UPI0015C30B89|nr:hypothetical protein [Paenibacillus sp. FSL H7-0331]
MRRKHLLTRRTEPLMTSRLRQGDALPITQNPVKIGTREVLWRKRMVTKSV